MLKNVSLSLLFVWNCIVRNLSAKGHGVELNIHDITRETFSHVRGKKLFNTACTTTRPPVTRVQCACNELNCVLYECVMLNKRWDMETNRIRVRLKWTNQPRCTWCGGWMVRCGRYWWFDKLYFNGKFSLCQKLCSNYLSNGMSLLQHKYDIKERKTEKKRALGTHVDWMIEYSLFT